MIIFDEATHTYYVDGKEANTSVTKMLHEQGLAPDYSGVSEAVLQKKADIGTAYHEEMERIVNGGEPESEYGKQFKEWFDSNVSTAIAEKAFAYQQDGYIIGGKVDLFGTLKGTLEPFVADFKFTATCPRDYVTWQTSVYDLMIERSYDHWATARLYCFHFTKGKMKVIELDHKPLDEVQKLLDCECHGDYYIAPEIAPSDENLPRAWESAELQLVALQAQIKAQEEEVKKFRERMAQAMSERGIVSYDGEHVKLTYIAPHATDRVDTDKLKTEYPEVYKDCIKTTQTKASIRVTVKK